MNKYKYYLLQKKLLKLRFMLISILGMNKTNWLKRHNVFCEVGDHFFYQPNKLPNEPQLIKFHNNVKVAANVTFYTHDVINAVFSSYDQLPYQTHASCIEIFDNCFIGGGAIIVGPCKIGPNAIVSAGAVVVKDVPEGTIVGGNPAKPIGLYKELKEKREQIDKNKESFNPEEESRKKQLWEEFSKGK